jgi:tetratricopeptide (TPR) repeat protein
MIRRFVFFFLFCIPLHSWSQWIGAPDFDDRAQQGINAVYNLEFDRAEMEFTWLAKHYPAHPAGKFFLGMIEWWKILIAIDDESRDDLFIKKMDDVIELCDSLLEINPDDITALFFKGGALGFQGRLRANRSSWIKAANDGRLALPIVQKAFALDPENSDILLGMGIYNYYASTIPERYPLVKPLMVFFPSGDKRKGIQQLEIASEKARYAGLEAQYFLLQLHYNYERQFDKALVIATSLHRRFPKNVLFHRYVGRSLFVLSRRSEAEVVFADIIRRCELRQEGYSDFVEREARYYLGLLAMDRRQWDESLDQFYRCDALSRRLDVQEQSGFMVLTNLRIGMIYDVQKKRKFAIMQYQKVNAMRNFENAQTLAQQYMKVPYGL